MQDCFSKKEARTVGIVGGKGKTGSQFAHIFRKLGFKVIVSDLGTRLSNAELIKMADVIVFSVPLYLSEKIIRDEMCKCVRKDQLILDVSSLKEKQVEAMNRAKGDVIGMHPLFGPSKRSFKGLSVVFCPGRCSRGRVKWLKELFEGLGFEISVMTPSEHDKLMAVVQVIPHLKTILAGELLKEFGVDPKKPYKISTPIYKLELDIIGRIFSQDGMLYSAIIAQNPYSKKLLKSLAKITQTYVRDAASGNLKNLNKRFDGVKKFLGKFSGEAFRDSEKVINKMQKWK